jgi:hypothetical protein
MNLAGFILGIEDKNYTIWATDNPLQNSGRDCQPAVEGVRFAVLFPKPQWFTAAFVLAIDVNHWFISARMGRVRRSHAKLLIEGLSKAGWPEWRRYLAIDGQSDWASRARRSLKFCEMQQHLIA